MSNFLKGTYNLDVAVDEQAAESDTLSEFEKKALNSIGGSMVFVERNKMTWDPEDEGGGSAS